MASEVNSFNELQNLVRDWRERNFPPDKRDAMHQTLGVAEETGELCHAVLKRSQGIRGTDEEHLTAAADAIGDTIIYLCGVCDALDIRLYDCVQMAYGEIMGRDWANHKETGHAD